MWKRWILFLSSTALVAQSFVVVELFTSQGCSSCPPADALLADLGGDDRVVALAFHVDYWDRLGWEDPYGSPVNTARQHRYNRILKTGRVYTPQMIVDGRKEFVGSDRRAAHAAIEGAIEKGHFGMIGRVDGRWLRCEFELPRPFLQRDLVVALTTDAVTVVKRGENRGRTLQERFIVRAFEVVSIDRPSVSVRLPIPEGSEVDHYKLVAFVQNPDTMAVLAANRIELSAPLAGKD